MLDPMFLHDCIHGHAPYFIKVRAIVFLNTVSDWVMKPPVAGKGVNQGDAAILIPKSGANARDVGVRGDIPFQQFKVFRCGFYRNDFRQRKPIGKVYRRKPHVAPA